MPELLAPAPKTSETLYGLMRDAPCDACGGDEFRELFYKKSERGEVFRLVSCRSCGLVQVNPQPDAAAVAPYYSSDYFTRRTDRGYADYFSEAVRKSINAVYEMNLRDLGFFTFEKEARAKFASLRSLDAGCAAGYFVDFMRSRGWEASGVEVSPDAARYGKDELGLNILVDDFLTTGELAPESFELVSFWASLEHMHSPRRVLKRAFELLRPGGRLLLSTCRYGILARARGINWRYMNVPEHLYFFSKSGLLRMARSVGFQDAKWITYGSGLTTRKDASRAYRIAKKIADPLVKILGQGDMIALSLEKPEVE